MCEALRKFGLAVISIDGSAEHTPYGYIDYININCVYDRNASGKGNKAEMEQKRLEVGRIIRNGKATVVIWKDGEKTIVRRAEDEAESNYAAFTAAIAIRLYGNNSKLKKMLEQKTVEQKPRKKKKEESLAESLRAMEDGLAKAAKEIKSRL